MYNWVLKKSECRPADTGDATKMKEANGLDAAIEWLTCLMFQPFFALLEAFFFRHISSLTC